MVLLSSRRIPRVPRYSGYSYAWYSFRLRGCYSVSPTFPGMFNYKHFSNIWVRNPIGIASNGLGCYPFARHYLGNRWFTFFSSRYLDVSVPSVPLITLCIHVMILWLHHSAFPHSEIHGSRLIYSSPWLIAVSCVLHRRLVPRHSLYALCSLIVFLFLW